MKLYIGNMSYNTVEDTLKELFSNYGEVLSVTIMKDKFTEQSKGFGFIEMSDETYERAIGGMNGKEVDGRRLRVSEAVEKPHRSGARKFFKSGDEGFRGERSDRSSRDDRGARRNRDFGQKRDSGRDFGRRKNFSKPEESIPSNEY